MGEQRARVRCVPAVPGWVSLMARDLGAAQAFYGPLLGWTFEPGPDRWGEYRWAVVDGRTAAQLAQVTGRLDWTAVWEDDGHFVTLAQGDAGGAAIVRCDVDGACERASRVWDVPLPSEPSLYYEPPPVVLAQR